MKKISLLVVPLVIAASSFITSCAEKCKVTFETNGGTEIKAVEVSKGSYLNRPVNPTKNGYIMSGWYKDPELEYKFSFRDDEVPDIIEKNTVLYVKWTDVGFNINYVIKNGTNSPDNPDSYLIKEDVSIAPASPNRGYEFGGWYDNQQFLGSPITGWGKHTHYSQVTLYAKIDPIVYSITYKDEKGAKDPGNPKTYTIEDNVVLKDAVLAGHTFTGWYIGQMEIPGWKPGKRIGDVTLTAKWDLDKYSITYDFAGGTDPENQISYTIEDDVVLKPSTRRGYDFTGWVDEDGNTVTGWAAGEKTGDIKLTATWKIINYDIAYEFAGGTDPSNPKTYTIEDSVTLKPSTRDGYNFIGWVDEKGNTVTGWAAGEKTGNIKLTAVWEIIPFDITYNLDGGINDPSNPKSYTANDTVTLKPATRPGYTFKGWFDGENIIEGWGPKEKTGPVVLTAQWEIISYDITYILNDGINDPSNPTSYTIDDDVTLKPATRDGYTFGGWSDGKNIIEGWKAGEKTEPITLSATWQLNTYTIKYNLNGGINDPSNPTSYTVSDDVTLKPATREGYLFNGWYDNDKFKGAPVTGWKAGKEGAVNLYAQWKEGQGNEIKFDTTSALTFEYNGADITEGAIIPYSMKSVEIKVKLSDKIPSSYKSHFSFPKQVEFKVDGGYVGDHSYSSETGIIKLDMYTNVTIVARPSYDGENLEGLSWSKISSISSNKLAKFVFAVGDTKQVKLIYNGEEQSFAHRVRIIDFDHDVDKNDKTIGITFEFADLITNGLGEAALSNWDHYSYDYRSSPFNTLLNGEILERLPSSLRSVIKTASKKVGITTDEWKTSTLATFYPKLFPLAHDEMVNHDEKVVEGEGSKYEYYNHKGVSLVKRAVGASGRIDGYYWTRSPDKGYIYGAWEVDNQSNILRFEDSEKGLGFAPAFCI